MTDFDPDAFLAANQGALPPPQAGGGIAPDQVQIQNFDPDDFIKQNQVAQETALQSKYGSTPQQVIAGIEGVARGGSLGTSDYLEQQAGISSADAIKGRMQANPVTAFGGNVLGTGLLTYGSGGFGGLAKAGLLGAAAEGAIFGGGNVVSDAALGDPNLNAQKILADIGMGAALGGGLGILSKAIGAVPAVLRGTKGAAEAVEGAEAPVVDVLGKKPTSLEEMQSRVTDAKKYGNLADIAELPQRAEALDANGRIGSVQQFPVTDMQLDSLNSQDARNEFKTMLEVPGKNGEILRNYQGAQKKELINVLDNTINKDIAADYEPTTNAVEAGERAAQSFTDAIQSTRDELGPAFEKIKSTALQDTNHLPGVIDYLTNPESSPYANPKIANMFDTSADKLAIKPYTTSMGIDGATYRGIKQVVTSLEENPDNFEKLADIRKGLSQNVDVMKLGDAPKEISAAKAAMMDYIQDAVQKVEPSQQVRDVFKKWAINEQNAQMIEKRFGAEIGSNNWRSLAKGGDESILKKIFRDSDSTAAAKAILPQQEFNQILADHLAILRNDATDKGVFSSNKFYSNFKRNQYALGEAFSNNAPAFQKMKDSLTLLRIFADDVPQNPSGTTKTLLQSLLNNGIDPFKHISSIVEYGKGKVEEAATARRINAKLAGQSDAAKKLTSVESILNRVNSQITSGVKGIFSPTTRGAALGAGTYLSDAAFNKMTKNLRGYYANPQSFLDDMASNTEHLHNAAPNITQGIASNMGQAVQFLMSKLPQATSQMPLSPPFEPSNTQKAQFNSYYQAVNDPVEALKAVKNGSLTNETLEALQAVHPQLLDEMRRQVMDTMKIEKVKELPYAQKLSLAKFLGQPLDNNMTPQAIHSNQISFNMPRQSTQSTPQQGRKAPLGGLKQLKFNTRAAVRKEEEL